MRTLWCFCFSELKWDFYKCVILFWRSYLPWFRNCWHLELSPLALYQIPAYMSAIAGQHRQIPFPPTHIENRILWSAVGFSLYVRRLPWIQQGIVKALTTIYGVAVFMFWTTDCCDIVFMNFGYLISAVIWGGEYSVPSFPLHFISSVVEVLGHHLPHK